MQCKGQLTLPGFSWSAYLSGNKWLSSRISVCVREKCLYNSSLAGWMFTSPFHRQSRNDTEVWLANEKLFTILALSLSHWQRPIEILSFTSGRCRERVREGRKNRERESWWWHQTFILQMRNVQLPLSVSQVNGQTYCKVSPSGPGLTGRQFIHL